MARRTSRGEVLGDAVPDPRSYDQRQLVVSFRNVVSDPPWSYRDVLEMEDTKRASGDHYPTMSVEAICALGEFKTFRTIAGHKICADGFLWLWITNPFLLDGRGARVCRAWGYEPVQLITWVKGRIEKSKLIPHVGMGHYTRGCTEHMILATRGSAKKQVQDKGVPNVFIAPRTTHSTKPDEAFALVERLSVGPYLELFARKARPGWTAWGLDAPQSDEATA